MRSFEVIANIREGGQGLTPSGARVKDGNPRPMVKILVVLYFFSPFPASHPKHHVSRIPNPLKGIQRTVNPRLAGGGGRNGPPVRFLA